MFLRINRAKNIVSAVLVILFFGVGGFVLSRIFENMRGPITSSFDSSVQSVATVLGDSYSKFTHPIYRFSVEYPKELFIERFLEKKDSETIIFQHNANSMISTMEEKIGFQIFVSPFGEIENVLTQERILEDLPSAVIVEPQEVIIGDGTHALLFWSEDPVIGKTREVWFISGGNLYEITTYAHLDSWLAKILSTWESNTL